MCDLQKITAKAIIFKVGATLRVDGRRWVRKVGVLLPDGERATADVQN